MKFGLIIILLSMNFSQNINFYNKDNESFADVKTKDFTFTCRVGGMENDKGTIFLLHGFPETSRMWNDFIKVLENEGYRIIAPDQRGYSKGARPSKVSDYTIDKLSQDIIDIANEFNINEFHLVGHDWGSAVGWYITSNFSDRIITWSALSVPHLDAFIYSMINDKEQIKKSEYIKFFNKPIFPEIYFKIFSYKNLKNIWSKSSESEIISYLETFKERRALKSALNWYRANFKDDESLIGDISTPTLIIYGMNDMAIDVKSVDNSEKFLKGRYKIEKLDSGQWLIQESFEEVSKSIIEHIN
jgi:pimeloyl-ACP methyl ester carboxylesterase